MCRGSFVLPGLNFPCVTARMEDCRYLDSCPSSAQVPLSALQDADGSWRLSCVGMETLSLPRLLFHCHSRCAFCSSSAPLGSVVLLRHFISCPGCCISFTRWNLGRTELCFLVTVYLGPFTSQDMKGELCLRSCPGVFIFHSYIKSSFLKKKKKKSRFLISLRRMFLCIHAGRSVYKCFCSSPNPVL